MADGESRHQFFGEPATGERDDMGFCNHCEGQRFDRARVLRTLRATRQRLRESDAICTADETLALAIEAVRSLDVPHLESLEDWGEDEVVH